MNKEKLRQEFFKVHTYKDKNRIPRVVTHPHNLFEWFYKQLTLTDVGVPKGEQLPMKPIECECKTAKDRLDCGYECYSI